MTTLWHNCPAGNSFGLYAEEPQACRVCRKIEQTPQVRNVYDALSDVDSNLINSDTFPMVVGRYEPGQVGGRT
jgi:hypothetical protein